MPKINVSSLFEDFSAHSTPEMGPGAAGLKTKGSAGIMNADILASQQAFRKLEKQSSELRTSLTEGINKSAP